MGAWGMERMGMGRMGAWLHGRVGQGTQGRVAHGQGQGTQGATT
jgi:hypothetical protein